MTRTQVRARMEDIGILPAIRVSSEEYACFAVEAVHRSGIPVAEITMTVPSALDVIRRMSQTLPDMVIGAGTVLDAATAAHCRDAGAHFISSPGFVPEVVEFALENDLVVLPGALTPSEVIAAWKAGSDFVKIFPCAPLGGAQYIRTLKVPLPQVPMIASGGVTQHTASDFISAGSSIIGIGRQLVPTEALEQRNYTQIHELARRFLHIVKDARARKDTLKHENNSVADPSHRGPR